MNILKKLNLLEQIERELSKVLKDDKKNWIKTARLLYKIEHEQLYELKARSYTQYIKQLAAMNHVNVSTLWRAKTAAATYMELSNLKDIELLEEKEIKTTPEQLETFKKVKSIAPDQITLTLQEKILNGEKIRNELNEIWETYRPLKKGKTERGRKSNPVQEPVFAEPDFFDVEEQKTSDLRKLSRYHVSEDELQDANIKNSLRDKSWVQKTLGKYYLPYFSTFPELILRDEVDNSINKIDMVAIAKTDNTKTGKPIVIGALILPKSFTPAESKIRWSKFFNYFYFVIDEVNNSPNTSFDVNTGLITVGSEPTKGGLSHHIDIIKVAKYQPVNHIEQSMLFAQLLKQRLKW